MSGCFNCGTIGHIARNCTNNFSSYSESVNGNYVTGRVFVRNKKNQNFQEKGVVCYKCNKFGHFARNCESENAVCYSCGKEGHLFKDCTVKKVCYNCNSAEHLVKDCPVNHLDEQVSDDIDISSRSDLASFRNDQCYNCKGFGHIARNCPKKLMRESICYRCNRSGHLARNCNFN